jgi:hypothetical protein
VALGGSVLIQTETRRMSSRRSGEAEAIREDDGEDTPRDAVSEPGEAVRRAKRPRPYPIWIKIEPGKRRLPPQPPHVSRSVWSRVSRQIAACLRQRIGSGPSLRQAVRALNAEMRLAGASAEDVATALRIALTEHPELHVLDRVNVVTRQMLSDALHERMLAWVAETETGE